MCSSVNSAKTTTPIDMSVTDEEEVFLENEKKRIKLNLSDQNLMVENVMTSEKFCRQYSDNEVSSDQNKLTLPKVLRQELDEHFEYDDELARTINRISKTISEIKATSVQHESAEFCFIQENSSQILENLSTTLDQLETIMVEVIKTHLEKWREEQRLSANGLRKKSAINIDLIRIWCQELVSIICHVHEKAKTLQSLQSTGRNSRYDQNLRDLLKRIIYTSIHLIAGTVIFVKQPPQVLRKYLK